MIIDIPSRSKIAEILGVSDDTKCIFLVDGEVQAYTSCGQADKAFERVHGRLPDHADIIEVGEVQAYFEENL